MVPSDVIRTYLPQLIVPPIVLSVAILVGRAYVRTPRENVRSALAIAATFPVWILLWTAMLLGCYEFVETFMGGKLPLMVVDLAHLIPPSVVFGLALWRFTGSRRMILSPIVASLVVVAVCEAHVVLEGRSFERLPAFATPWSPYLWILVVIGFGFWIIRRQRHQPKHGCPHCLYELNGLGAVSVCPECGNHFAPAATTAG